MTEPTDEVLHVCGVHGCALPCPNRGHWPIRCRCRTVEEPKASDTHTFRWSLPQGIRLASVADIHRLVGMHIRVVTPLSAHLRYIVTGTRLDWHEETGIESILLGLMLESKIDDGVTMAVDLYAKEGS